MFDQNFINKVEALRTRAVDPWPAYSSSKLETFDLGSYTWLKNEEETTDHHIVYGRVKAVNRLGKICFVRIDYKGTLVQIVAKKNVLDPEVYKLFDKLDIGDIVSAKGFVFRTKAGEISICATEGKLLSKIMTTIGDPIADTELRARKRYLDLYTNPDSLKTFKTRSHIIQSIRNFLCKRDYIEVETPMMQPIPGGANARPFVTHHNTLDINLFLRIAPELYLKKLIVGGFDKVFEIGRNFRNEGISSKHNPEFTSVEFYCTYVDYHDMINTVQSMIMSISRVFAELRWHCYTMEELLMRVTNMSSEDLRNVELMNTWYEGDAGKTVGECWQKIFDTHVEHTLVEPTFVTEQHIDISPLSRRKNNTDVAERFELYINGIEIANGFNELNDPVDQYNRFKAQAEAHTQGDDEAMYLDTDFVEALCYAMPPTAGVGIGIDRLVMLATGKTSIKEVILFPTMRPEKE